MSFPEGEREGRSGFPVFEVRVSPQREALLIRLGNLREALFLGVFTVKPGHRIKGMEGTGRGQTEPIRVPYTWKQIRRREAEITHISRKLGII